jgi:hypothetical protein
VPFLGCLLRHKNQILSSKASALSTLIEKKIIQSLFEYKNENQLQTPINNNFTKEMMNSLTSLITADLNKKANAIKQNTNNHNHTISKRQINKKKELNQHQHNSNNSINNYYNLATSYNKLNLNLTTNLTKEEESNSISEISLDSHKTDCEDSKSHTKPKMVIIPLENKNLMKILYEYFTMEVNCSEDLLKDPENENEFLENLSKGKFFKCLNNEKILTPVKYHYMRRRVCYKLFKVFEKIVN